MLEEDAGLVDLIYAAALGEQSWSAFMTGLAETSPGSFTLLFAFDTRRQAQVVNILQGRPDEAKQDLEAYFGAINPYAPHCMVKPLGIGVAGDRLVPHKRLARTEFYNDFMQKLDTSSTVGIAVDRSPLSTILISTATRQNDEDEQRRIAAQYTRLAPHLSRVAQFYRRNAPSRMATELGASLFDAVDVGVVLVTHDMRVASISAAAQRIAGDRLLFDAAGRLRLPLADAQAALRAMCERRYDGAQSQVFAGAGLKLTLVKISQGGVIDMFDDCGVAVMVSALGGIGAHMDPDAIARAYGLTPAEKRVLEGVLAGRTTDEIARAAGRSRETIRSQLKSIYAKTGSMGRADLLRLLTGHGAGLHPPG